ncbi:MAG: ATP-binding protein [Ferrovibrio sp.]|uniref:ATP-binding protein n=1 Tax=Ferrovibrio sp. TaxID=1917215 RepID=UPI002616500A|nr:ATP-binding protein [Ferrovibrio sp.]MCW0233462.1 ATP-binding protein [Ferrovibrio sp.]
MAPQSESASGGVARRNELLVRVRRPLDMALQVFAAVAVVLLLDDYLPLGLRLGYLAATASVVGLQYLTHRRFMADRERRSRAGAWRWRLIAVYSLNGALFGATAATIVSLPYEAAPLLALLCVVGMIVSVSLTVAVQLVVSGIVIVLSVLPGVVTLMLAGLPDQRLFGAAGLIVMVLLFSFAHRLNRYFRRTTDLVERLRMMLQDRTRSSADAEAAQRRLRSILDTAPFPIVVARRNDGAFLYSNRPAAELFGIEDNSPTAAPRYVLDPVHRERIFNAGAVQPEEELQIATVQGRAIWATMAAVPMRYGEEDAALVVVNDITAKKASEEKLREAEQRLIDALAVAPDGVALFDGEQRLLVCNPAYAGIIGVPLEAIAGMTHQDICLASVRARPAPQAAGVQTDYQEWLDTRRRTFTAGRSEPHIFYDTRDRRWLQIRDFRLDSGGTASLITDITVLKRSERELREANDTLAARGETLEAARKAAIKAHQDAEYANRAKSQFLAHMSHELRTPLNAIIGFSEIMALQLLGASGVPQYDRYANDILAAGRHLLAVIDDILDLSKVEAGKMKLAAAPVPWDRLFQDCMTLLRPLAADRMVTLQVEPAPEGATVFADERLAKQMLVNLLSNAVKYTPSGGYALIRLLPGADGSAVVEVVDSGVGMDQADVQKALEPFGRIDSALVSQMRGTGLGLPLVKALIELHGGRLDIESVPGTGTTVRLYFPAPQAPQLQL